MKNVIKGLILATFALSFGACNTDKPVSNTASVATETAKTVDTISTSMANTATTAATTSAAAASMAATAAAGAVKSASAQTVKPSAAQTTPAPPVAAPAAVGKTTTIKFEESSYAWGSVNEGDKMTHIFKFKNTGSNDLIISDAHGSCGCTAPDWPKEPIKAGKTGEIKVVFDSKGKAGDQQKTVTLTANTEPASTILTIKGTVKAAAEEKK